MKRNTKQLKITMNGNRMVGGMLLEVVLAIAVFAFGMLALVQLQGNLTRSSADANTRTVATNIAEELVETLRGFRHAGADPLNGMWDYDELDFTNNPLNTTETRGGVEYAVEVTIRDFWQDDEDSYESFYITDVDNPDLPTRLEGMARSDFKLLQVKVTWNANQEFYVDDENTEVLGDNSITIYEIMPSSPPNLGAKIAANINEPAGTPSVDYNPGENPDIIAVKLGDQGKFKESTSPTPEVIRDTNQTWFDVVTYSVTNEGDREAYYLRREEFVAVICECELLQAAEGSGGLRPTLWNGYTYTEGEFVSKDYGQRANGSPDNPYCDICCRDHHDDGVNASEEHVYNSLTATNGGDHRHFSRDNQVVPVGYGQDYVEACRLIRKDGFMRVTKDAVQQGLYGFPEEYLTFDDNLLNYSEYVIAATEGYYGSDQQNFDQPEDMSPPYIIPASTPETATDLPTVYFSNTQQLRSRGLYTDYLTEAASLNVDNCFDNAGEPTPGNEGCNVPNASSPLEIYPFFDLQMTWLARWEEYREFISVSNDSLTQKNPPPSRGFAELDDITGQGQTEVTITSHSGNLGLTATGPIDDSYHENLNTQLLYIDANLDNTPASNVGSVVSGTLTSNVESNKPFDASNMQIDGDQALCGQTDVEYSCLVKFDDPDAPVGKIVVSGYFLKNTDLWICGGAGLTKISSVPNPDGGTLSTTFQLPQDSETLALGVGLLVTTDEFCN